MGLKSDTVMQKPLKLKPIWAAILVFSAVVPFEYAGAVSQSYEVVFQTDAGTYEFKMPPLNGRGAQQRVFLSDHFQSEFRIVKDLTPERVHSFLAQYPDNRDALVDYLVALPARLITEDQRVILLRAIEQFRVKEPVAPEIKSTSLNSLSIPKKMLRRAAGRSSLLDASDGVALADEQQDALFDRLMFDAVGRQGSGFDFRFYRGLLLEYQFESPTLLQLDVRNQRVLIQWDLD